MIFFRRRRSLDPLPTKPSDLAVQATIVRVQQRIAQVNELTTALTSELGELATTLEDEYQSQGAGSGE